MTEENHGWTIGWALGGLVAGLLFSWPANCISEGSFGAQRVEYSSGAELAGQIECTNVLGMSRVTELDQFDTAIASVVLGVLLGAIYEVYLWWRRSQSANAEG